MKLGIAKSGVPPNEDVYVDKVLPGSAAAQAGVQVDMRFVRVNGRSMRELSMGEFAQFLKDRPLTVAFQL